MIKYLISFLLFASTCLAGMGIGGFPFPGPGVMVSNGSSGGTEILRPTGVGTHNEFTIITGGTYAWETVDEATYSDTDYIQSDDGYDRQTFAWQNTSASSGHTITKVRMYVRISRTSTVFVNGYELVNLSPSVDTVLETKYHDMTTNPSTGTSWTSSGIDSIDAGVMAQNNAPRVSQVYLEVYYE